MRLSLSLSRRRLSVGTRRVLITVAVIATPRRASATERHQLMMRRDPKPPTKRIINEARRRCALIAFPVSAVEIAHSTRFIFEYTVRNVYNIFSHLSSRSRASSIAPTFGTLPPSVLFPYMGVTQMRFQSRVWFEHIQVHYTRAHLPTHRRTRVKLCTHADVARITRDSLPSILSHALSLVLSSSCVSRTLPLCRAFVACL